MFVIGGANWQFVEVPIPLGSCHSSQRVDCLLVSLPKDAMLPNFPEKTIANSYKTLKFENVLALKSFSKIPAIQVVAANCWGSGALKYAIWMWTPPPPHSSCVHLISFPFKCSQVFLNFAALPFHSLLWIQTAEKKNEGGLRIRLTIDYILITNFLETLQCSCMNRG